MSDKMQVIPNGLWKEELKPIVKLETEFTGILKKIIKDSNVSKRQIVMHTRPEGLRHFNEAIDTELQNNVQLNNNTIELNTSVYLSREELIRRLDQLSNTQENV